MLLATKQLHHLAQLQRQCISPDSIKENTIYIHAIFMYPWNAAELPVNMPFLRTECIFSHKVKTYRQGRCDSIWLDYKSI